MSVLAKRKPFLNLNQDSQFGVKASLFGHGFLLACLLLSHLFFQGQQTPYIPSLRVDLVGLPDDLKNHLASSKRKQLNQEISQVLKAAEASAREAKVLKETIKKEDLSKAIHVKKIKEASADRENSREKKNKQALNRIKLFSKLKDFSDANLEEADKEDAPLIKGNQISPGSSVSGDAKENAVTTYYDDLRERIQSHWSLPAWLARQNLSAQVQLFIDASGRIKDFEWVRTSGNSAFDEGTKRAIYESQPFAAVPLKIQNLLITRGILVGFPL